LRLERSRFFDALLGPRFAIPPGALISAFFGEDACTIAVNPDRSRRVFSSIELISSPSGELGSTSFKPLTRAAYSGPSCFSNSLTFPGQRLNFLFVLLLIGLADLLAEMVDLAIGLDLSLIATDDADNLLCIRLQLGHVRLLSLRVQWQRGKKQKPNDRRPVHKFPDGSGTFPSNNRAIAKLRGGALR